MPVGLPPTPIQPKQSPSPQAPEVSEERETKEVPEPETKAPDESGGKPSESEQEGVAQVPPALLKMMQVQQPTQTTTPRIINVKLRHACIESLKISSWFLTEHRYTDSSGPQAQQQTIRDDVIKQGWFHVPEA